LRILEFLVLEENHDPPSVIDVVKWRQSHILRWMIDTLIFDPNALAVGHRDVIPHQQSFEFLGGEAVPTSMIMAEFLCFLAVEFDDYESLCFLLSDLSPSILQMCNGWNLVHVCIHFGRREIFQFLLCEKPAFAPLVQECSHRFGSQGLFAVHLAIRWGFVYLVELLLDCGCPSVDENGHSILWHASNVPNEYIRAWAKEKERPLALENDIRKLFILLGDTTGSLDGIKGHLKETKCLDIGRWIDCGFPFYNFSGPMGKSYLDVLVECCSFRYCTVDQLECMLGYLTIIPSDWRCGHFVH
jgi:Ankyrin repeats (3 copies)